MEYPMLTLFAWIVFIPAFGWFITITLIFLSDVISGDFHYFNSRNIRDLAFSVLMVMIPGVYLFGLF